MALYRSNRGSRLLSMSARIEGIEGAVEEDEEGAGSIVGKFGLECQ